MELSENYTKFKDAGAEVVAISMDGPVGTFQMSALAKADYPVLSDPEGEAVKSYGVFDLLDDGVAAPAVLIIGQSRAVEWRQVGEDIGDRPSAAEILERLEAL